MQNNTLAPKNFFLQIGVIFTLYVSAISFLTFLFAVIDKAFPLALSYYDDSTTTIRYSISVLIILFPLFIWLSRMYRRFSSEFVEVKESRLRKWVTYFTLFITGVTMAIDAIVLVNTFLGGESLAGGFMLKVLSVFVVALAIFYYFLKDLKGYFEANPKQSKIWSVVVSIVVVLTVVGGFVVIGSPSHQRNVNLDAQRVGDLSNIQYQIVNYYQQKGVLPQSLKDLSDPLSGTILPKDPESQADYGYGVINKLSFKVCADFKTESKVVNQNGGNIYIDLNSNENWKHGMNNVCFERTIDPERYPLINSKIKN